MDSKICVTVKHNMTIRRCASVDVLNKDCKFLAVRVNMIII